MNLQEVHKIVGRLKLSLFKNSNSFSIGMLKSHFKGTGLKFKEHQVYTHGDDVRFIDWKILAKTNNPYIKTFEEERNVVITVAIDVSETMFTGFEGVSKLQAAIEITCLLYLLAKETNDEVHVLLVTDQVISIPGGRGEKSIAQFISFLNRNEILTDSGMINLSYQEKTRDSARVGKDILRHMSKNREVIILSDLHNFIDEEWLSKIYRHKSLHCFKVVSPLDEAKTIPYLMKTKYQGQKFWSKTNLKDDQEKDEKGYRFKKINISNRYLEEFVKEMM